MVAATLSVTIAAPPTQPPGDHTDPKADPSPRADRHDNGTPQMDLAIGAAARYSGRWRISYVTRPVGLPSG
jgi:hypothetical protein